MLRRFRAKNFYSIRDELELTLLLGKRTPDDARSSLGTHGEKISKLMVLIGHNASGKTNILKVLAFVSWFMQQSFHALKPDEQIPFAPHFSTPDLPTEFEVEFEYDDKIWRYSLTLTPERVLHESLHQKRKRFAYVFKRDWNKADNHYTVAIKSHFGLGAREAKKVRPNASLLATAAQYGVTLAQELVNLNINTNLNAHGRRGFDDPKGLFNAARFFHASKTEQLQANQLLSEWDLGLERVSIQEHELKSEDGNKATLHMPYGVHRANGKDHEINFLLQSSGTRSAYILLSMLLPILKHGGLAVIDELENDLHPHMLDAIINLFLSPESNPHSAQLIFSSHSHNLLNSLLKEQIVLVEKDETLNTWAYSLDQVEGVRVDDNFYAKYLAGAYGGVPEF